MVRMCARLLLMAAVAVPVSGCVTQQDAYLIGPIHVRVLDARSLLPIAGAKVVAASPSDPRVTRQTVSGRDGAASLTPLKGQLTALPFGSPPPVMLTVTAKGYTPYRAALPDVGATSTPTYYLQFPTPFYGRVPDVNPPPNAILLTRRKAPSSHFTTHVDRGVSDPDLS